MPYPTKDETKAEYIKKFMESSEAQEDFPDDKQRVAVAYSLWEKRNSSADHPWPKAYKCSFIEPGVVAYQDLGPCKKCGTQFTCVQPGRGSTKPGSGCQPTGEVVLVKQEALAKLAPTFVGKPVIDMAHEDVEPDTVANGDADGIVTRVWLDQVSGWWMCEFLVWSPEAQRHCESVAFSVSCAYEPTAVDEKGGEYHNIPYAQEILDGKYTHLALVTNPRYEGAKIFVNSKVEGGKMDWKWLTGKDRKATDLDPIKTVVDVDGKSVSLQTLFNSVPKAPVLSDSTALEIDGKSFTLAQLKQAYRNSLKNAEPAVCKACNGSGKEKAAGSDAALDDLRSSDGAQTHPHPKTEFGRTNDSEANPNGVVAEAKKNSDDEDKAKKDAELAKLAEKKNADDAAAKKEADEKALAEKKKNADDAAAKKDADEKAALEEKRNAGRRAFADFRNARTEHVGDAVAVQPVSLEDRLAIGASKYGTR